MTDKIKALRPTYAEIDLQAFGHNLEEARRLGGTDAIAVVKADAYGHGELEVSEYIYHNHGVNRFAVATIMEGMILREHLGHAPAIYLLGMIDDIFFPEAVEHGLTLTIPDHAYAKRYDDFLKKHNVTAEVSVKLNTGMNRLGLDCSMNWYDFTSSYSNFRPSHVMSHLSSADSDREYTEHQIQVFNKFIKKNRIQCSTSLFNSAGIAGYKNIFSLTRPGIMLYGYLEEKNGAKLKKVMRVFSKIAQVQHLKKGDAVSYNRKYFADRDMPVGVVPIGYADGYPRVLSNKSHMYVDGVKCPVIGTVCMDMVMVDLSGVDLSGGLIVEVMGDNIGADELARMADTIPYEILTGIQQRIPRIYKG